jgi:uroporphyrin-III C-methyltransferase/precorrin-2 dehydrogenase/sirohydrochlorin ferrochelatase
VEFLPVFLDVKGRDCLLVGGGEVAARKGAMLARAGARLHVVAPHIDPAVRQACLDSGGVCHERAFREADIASKAVVIAATDDKGVNRQVHASAVTACIPVNVVDQPELCTFIFPSVIDRDPVLVAISTGGNSPVLARHLRTRLESLVPAAYGRLGALFGSFRDRAKQVFPDVVARRVFWDGVLAGPLPDLVFNGRESDARQWLQDRFDAEASGSTLVGDVSLVGAGPGDPDLLTFKALRLMQQADVVVHDRLVSEAVLDLVRRDAERIYVGKKRGEHSVPQEDINQLLVTLARQGKRVCRLKGGDPFIFGRGGEEIDTLASQGIPFQVVPGITAASGCACYAGIPLTHRDHAQSVRFVTGHAKDGLPDLPWQELATPAQTLVFYMGLVGLPEICRQLVSHGRHADTPVALIQQGTLPSQKVIVGTLSTIVSRCASEVLEPPTLTIVGEVVSLRERLDWFHPVT